MLMWIITPLAVVAALFVLWAAAVFYVVWTTPLEEILKRKEE